MLALPVAHPLGVVGVHLIKGAPDAFVSLPAYMRRISETPLSIEQKVNKTVLNFDFWRNVKQLAQIFNHEFSSPKKRGPLFSFEDVTARNEMQTLILVNNKQSFAMVLK